MGMLVQVLIIAAIIVVVVVGVGILFSRIKR